MHVFLVGYMGSGKSTWGKRLAKAMQLPFVDLDKRIERDAAQSVSQIFLSLGEQAFRQMEREKLREVLVEPPCVVATGGGTPLNGESMSLMLHHGVVVYLQADAAFLASRIRQAPGKRPVLKNVADENLTAFIEQHLQARSSIYRQSHATVSAVDLNLNLLLNTVKQLSEDRRPLSPE